MKYSLTCGDMGSTTCNYVAEGSSADEAAANMLAHAKDAHPDDLAKMDLPDGQILEVMKSKATPSE